MKTKNSGFTLIELVVVIVILGILASQAVPRFANLTDNANQAVAEGVLASFLSQAVINYGANSGVADTFANINADVVSGLSGDATGAVIDVDGGAACGGANVITVTLSGQTATANVSTDLCSG